MQLDGKICIVTGASKGIGLAIAEIFAKEGAVVYSLSRSAGEWSTPDLIHWEKCDVSSENDIETAIAKIAQEKGRIDVLVNNAGVTKDGLAARMSLEDWNFVITANLTSAFLTSRAVAKKMIAQRSGAILNISSVVGLMGNGGQVNYSASKAGMIGLTKSLARELASRGIRVNALAPGYIDTAMTAKIPEAAREKLASSIPLGKTGSPDDIAQAALFLCSDHSRYITGEVLRVDGGMAM